MLIAYALYASRTEKLGDPGTRLANVSSLLFASAIALLGPLLYWFTAVPLARQRSSSEPAPELALFTATAQGPKKASTSTSLGSLFPNPCFYTATFFFVS